MPEFKENKGLFLRPFSIKGRIGRKEYIISSLLIVPISLAIVSGIGYIIKSPIIAIFWIPIFWFLFAQSCKRGHDLGWPLILQILLLLFPLMWVPLIIFKGDEGDNCYGNSPIKDKRDSNLNNSIETKQEEKIEEKIYCRFCGEKIDYSGQYCKHCGKKL